MIQGRKVKTKRADPGLGSFSHLNSVLGLERNFSPPILDCHPHGLINMQFPFLSERKLQLHELGLKIEIKCRENIGS